MNVVLVYAMQAEAEPFLKACAASEVPLPAPAWLPFRVFHCPHETLTLHALVSGVDARFGVDNIGLEAATLMAYIAIEHLAPDVLVSCGTAGGFAARGAQIGTVYLGDTFLFHDRHVPLPGFDRSGLSKTSTFDAGAMADRLALPRVNVSSGSSLMRSAADITVMSDHDARAKEMEAAALAWVCQLSGVRLLAVKSVTNLLDHEENSEAQFERHFSSAVQALARETRRVVADFAAHPIPPRKPQ